MKRMIAVGAVIVEDDKVVLGKHVPERKGFWSGKWICPGGRLELGEAIVVGLLEGFERAHELAEGGVDVVVGGGGGFGFELGHGGSFWDGVPSPHSSRGEG